ncbi:YegP family protein [Kitasatospora sp. NBC_00458]|uniref:YegP family protein n=1 Tax=Kitasatospora sp. NBC_00458 TaxID=2903568 RepID=UPI002E184689
MAGKFEVYEDAGGKFRFRLKAGNGEIVATGQGYASKDAAHKGVEAVQRAAAGAPVVDVAKAAA